jgi:hypothetical protein
MRSIKPTTIRLDDEDIKLVEIIKRKYGQSSLIGALRVALRVASEQTIHKSITEQGGDGKQQTTKGRP